MTQNFTPPAPLQTAVLFLVFNSPDTTAQVFAAIRKAQPPRLYVAADGPREGRDGEAERVARVQEIATAVDWPCEVQRNYADSNLGLKQRVSSGLDWVFEQLGWQPTVKLEEGLKPTIAYFEQLLSGR